MEYKKISLQKYNIHLIKTDKFKTITIKVNFKAKLDKSNYIKRMILSKLFILSNSNYTTERNITIKNEELFNPKIQFGTDKSGLYNIITVDITFLNEKYTEKNMNSYTIDFIKNLIFNISLSEGKINENALLIAKRSLKDELNSTTENKSLYSLVKLREYSAEPLAAMHPYLFIDEIDNINEEDMIKTYQDMINNDFVDIFINGDIDETIIENFKNLPFLNNILLNEKHIVSCKNFKNEELVIIEKDQNKQSKLAISYKFKNISEFERNYVMFFYNYILGGSSTSRLFKSLREENSLCYTVRSSFNANYDMLEIQAGIDSINFDLSVKLIKDEINNMKLGNFDESLIESAKKTYFNYLENIEDRQGSMIGIILSKEYYNTDLVEDRIKNIDNVTKDMICALASKLTIDTIFLLEGEGND